MEQDKTLTWELINKEQILHTPVFDVNNQIEKSATGIEGKYVSIDAPDWVIVIPSINDDKGDDFLMVRQWRHSSLSLSTEFPGGVVDEGEDVAVSGQRELLEETGYKAGKFTKLGQLSPNPALFSNQVHIYLAEDLEHVAEQRLDDDEVLKYMRISKKEVIDQFGTGEYTHGLMGLALGLYLRKLMK